jgi:hypothetical protein
MTPHLEPSSPNLRPNITAIIRGRLASNPHHPVALRPIERRITLYGLYDNAPGGPLRSTHEDNTS